MMGEGKLLCISHARPKGHLGGWMVRLSHLLGLSLGFRRASGQLPPTCPSPCPGPGIQPTTRGLIAQGSTLPLTHLLARLAQKQRITLHSSLASSHPSCQLLDSSRGSWFE